jgi:hypothetical protein
MTDTAREASNAPIVVLIAIDGDCMPFAALPWSNSGTILAQSKRQTMRGSVMMSIPLSDRCGRFSLAQRKQKADSRMVTNLNLTVFIFAL